MNTPRRTIRIEDELWTAAVAKANEEGTTVTEVIRNALSAYVKAGAAVLVGLLAVLLLGACGGAEPGTSAVSEPTASTPNAATTTAALSDAEVQSVIDASVWVDLDADPEVHAILVRVVRGECFSLSFGPTAIEWSEHMAGRPEATAGSVWQANFDAWVATLPVGCDEVDREALD